MISKLLSNSKYTRKWESTQASESILIAAVGFLACPLSCHRCTLELHVRRYLFFRLMQPHASGWNQISLRLFAGLACLVNRRLLGLVKGCVRNTVPIDRWTTRRKETKKRPSLKLVTSFLGEFFKTAHDEINPWVEKWWWWPKIIK